MAARCARSAACRRASSSRGSFAALDDLQLAGGGPASVGEAERRIPPEGDARRSLAACDSLQNKETDDTLVGDADAEAGLPHIPPDDTLAGGCRVNGVQPCGGEFLALFCPHFGLQGYTGATQMPVNGRYLL